jgi:acyl-CoA dehydrogenase
LSGDHVRSFLGELKGLAEDVGRSPVAGFGETAKRLKASIADLEAASEWLLSEQAGSRTSNALAGATPYQRLFGLVLTGYYLAKGGLVDVSDGGQGKRVALCRFAAENLLAETAALKDRVVNGATSLEAARIALS